VHEKVTILCFLSGVPIIQDHQIFLFAVFSSLLFCCRFVICRLVGSHYPIELIMERGRRYECGEIQVVTVPEMSAMNPHVASVCSL
jgi:NADH:ubiquinone oxidoreductase subunit 3 (subunit A)